MLYKNKAFYLNWLLIELVYYIKKKVLNYELET